MAKAVRKEKKQEVKKTINIPKLNIPKVDFKKVKDTVVGKFNSDKVFKIALVVIAFVFSFAVIDLFIQYLNNGYSAAIVNGVRITKSDYMTRLEKTYGLTTATNLIQEELVKQGATKEGVSVTDKEIQDRLNEYYNENGGRDSVLATLKENNFTEEDVREQIRIGILLEKTLSKKVTYTDKDLEDFFNQYKSVLYTDSKVKFADKKDEITQYYINKSIQDMKDTWLAGLEKDAKIQNNVSSPARYGFFKTTANIVKNLYNEIQNKLKK